MGFEFKDRTVSVEVCGKHYEVVPGDADFIQAVTSKQAELQSMDESELAKDPAAIVRVSDGLRGLIDSVLGEGEAAALFEGRKRNLLDEIELLAYLLHEINQAPESYIDSVLNELNVGQPEAKKKQGKAKAKK